MGILPIPRCPQARHLKVKSLGWIPNKEFSPNFYSCLVYRFYNFDSHSKRIDDLVECANAWNDNSIFYF